MSRGFSIKPLVWRFFDVKGSFGQGVWDANGINITYSIEDVSETFQSDPFYCSRLSKQFASLEEAQQAAQLHHEAAIRYSIEMIEDTD